MADVRLSTETTDLDGVPVIRVHGEIDIYTVPEFERALNDAVVSGATSVIVDLTDISYIDSAGLGALLYTYKRLMERDGQLLIIADPKRPGVRRVIEITRFDRLFHVYDTLDSLLQDISLRKAT